ncbi:MAG: HEAT repeat domain-containing protein [Planctomycetota bacterium]|jgi:HEAT repeat protein
MRARWFFLVLLVLPVAAEDTERQVDWVGDWDAALKQAKETDRPLMVCINSKDLETANEKTARLIYRDPEFVERSRKFVMVVISTIIHRTSGTCPRFGRVTCAQHLACCKALAARYGEQLATAFAAGGEMITPQHVWLKPDGTLMRRKEYWLEKQEILARMRKVLNDLASAPEPEGDATADDKDAPLSEKDKAELHRVDTADKESRRAALGNLLATEKTAAYAALVERLQNSKRVDVRCDICRALGRSQVRDARPYIEACLSDRSELLRSFAAVALEELAHVDSVPVLIKRAKSEKDTQARKNMYRALGACGGPVADKDAAKALLKAVRSDKQNSNRKHAAYSLRTYKTDEGKKLVVRKLEKAALSAKDRGVRGGIVYTLAHIGDVKTTMPVFRKILDKLHDPMSQGFLRLAMRKLRGEPTDFGRSTWFLLWEDREDPARRG